MNRQYKIVLWSLLPISIVLNVLFFDWAHNSLYDPFSLEQRGHQLSFLKQHQKAYNDFVQAAKLSETRKEKANRYIFAAHSAYATINFSQTLAVVIKALENEPQNKQAIHFLNIMLEHKQIKPEQIKHLDQEILMQLKN